MTALDIRPDLVTPVEADPNSAPASVDWSAERTVAPAPPTPGRLVLLGVVWVVVAFVSMMLVLYGLEPIFQERTQSQLLSSYRLKIERAANETGGLGGVTVPTLAPELGSAVAIIEIGKLQIQQVVVEGAQSSQTQAGPGHVPGTAGPGQPGNAAIVGRRGTFGAPFRNLDKLEPDDPIVVTTTQGQAVYRVASVSQQRIDTSDARAELLGSTSEDRLTLVTSAEVNPRNGDLATVVVAKLSGLPFPPTPQGGRTDSQTGHAGDAAAWPPFVLALAGFALAAAAAVVLYRRSSVRIAYLLTTPPLIAFVILAAESFSRFFPAWM